MSSGHDTIDIQSHIKVYMTVFAALAVLTIVTVAVSYLDPVSYTHLTLPTILLV